MPVDPAPQIEASVIVPVYNSMATLAECLESLLAQEGPQLEILVVDDASTDGSVELVESFQARDPRVRLLRSNRNLGPGGARNLAIRASRSRRLLFLDADCVAPPDWAYQHCEALDQASEDRRIVGGPVVGIHATLFGRADGYCGWFGSLPSQPRGRRVGEHLPTANLATSRAVFERIGLFREEEVLFSEDAEFCERAQRLGVEIWFEPRAGIRHKDRNSLGGYLQHQWTAGIQMIHYRREAGAAYHWLMPRGWISGALLCLPLAGAYTGYLLMRWWRYDPRVLAFLPLLFVGKLAQTIAMAIHSRRKGPFRGIAAPTLLPSD